MVICNDFAAWWQMAEGRDARETLDAFLRFVNSPEDVGIRANAQFSVRNGTCAADEKSHPSTLPSPMHRMRAPIFGQRMTE